MHCEQGKNLFAALGRFIRKIQRFKGHAADALIADIEGHAVIKPSIFSMIACGGEVNFFAVR